MKAPAVRSWATRFRWWSTANAGWGSCACGTRCTAARRAGMTCEVIDAVTWAVDDAITCSPHPIQPKDIRMSRLITA